MYFKVMVGALKITEIHTEHKTGLYDATELVNNLGFTLLEIKEQVEAITGKKHFVYISRTHVYPVRVIKLPEVGEEVSRGFNGDYYPCGKIVRISKSYGKIVTEDGTVFIRQKKNPVCWLYNKYSSMVPGRIDERNPHF